MRELHIGKNDAGQRLDKFITKALPDLPHSLLYKSVRTKKIKVNRKRAEIGQILAEGDALQLFLPEEFFTADRGNASLLSSVRIPLSLLYEDENILLINKPAGISVHEDEGGSAHNLLTALHAYLYRRGEYDPASEQSFAPALCNRIDRNTAGIVIAAKNAASLRVMNEKIKNRELSKFYLTAVHGVPKRREATLSAYLLRNKDEKTVRIYEKDPPRDALTIKTRYRTLASGGALSLLEVELLTGRTHQIRAHLAHIGHPLLGDGKYGKNAADRKAGYAHQALVSYRLRFDFSDESTHLDYLSGKEFSIPLSEIPFLKEFPSFNTDSL